MADQLADILMPRMVEKRGTDRKIKTQVENEELVGQKHQQIIQAASELFSKKGYHRTTMRDISKASGIDLSYLYRFISSKDDILYLYYRHLDQQWRDVYRPLAEDTEEDPVQQLKNFIQSFLEVALRLNREMLTMYTESRHLEKDSLYAVLAMEYKSIKFIEQLIIRGVEREVFKVDDAWLTANIIQYLLVFRALRGWNFKDRYTFGRFVNLMTRYILRSLGVNP